MSMASQIWSKECTIQYFADHCLQRFSQRLRNLLDAIDDYEESPEVCFALPLIEKIQIDYR